MGLANRAVLLLKEELLEEAIAMAKSFGNSCSLCVP